MTSFVADPLCSDEIGPYLVNDGIYILVPTFKEITGSLMKSFNTKQTVVFDGGLTRDVGPKNNDGFYPIIQTSWESIDDFKNHVSILKVSDEDIANIIFPASTISIKDKLKYLNYNGFPHVVLTQGDMPTLISLINKKPLIVPVFPLSPLSPHDSAGAGDTFNVGYTVRFMETGSPLEAAAFGNACASLKVEGKEITPELATIRAQQILQ
jgi:sugar/nucleoside kinase (ribokinase family)